MRTDRRPSGPRLAREFDESTSSRGLSTPPEELLGPVFEKLASAIKEEGVAGLRHACSEFLGIASDFYRVSPPELKLLGTRPHRTREGHLVSELFGDYDLKDARIRLWTRTPMRKQWTSVKTIVSTLCHEFMHHLDVHHFKYPHTYHTMGFYDRSHRLYIASIGEPYYTLEWQTGGRSGSSMIDWAATRRRREKALARQLSSGAPPDTSSP